MRCTVPHGLGDVLVPLSLRVHLRENQYVSSTSHLIASTHSPFSVFLARFPGLFANQTLKFWQFPALNG